MKSTNNPIINKYSQYKVKQGDTLSHIAVAHGMKWQDLLSIPGNESFIANPDLIHPGDIVHLAGE